MDNSAHFWTYNTGLSSPHQWRESPFFLNLYKERRQRSAKIAREKKERLTRRELQRSILQLLIDADCKLVHVNDIAEHIGRSPKATAWFLSTHADDLWIGVNGGRMLWMTSLRILPDRLFY